MFTSLSSLPVSNEPDIFKYLTSQNNNSKQLMFCGRSVDKFAVRSWVVIHALFCLTFSDVLVAFLGVFDVCCVCWKISVYLPSAVTPHPSPVRPCSEGGHFLLLKCYVNGTHECKHNEIGGPHDVKMWRFSPHVVRAQCDSCSLVFHWLKLGALHLVVLFWYHLRRGSKQALPKSVELILFVLSQTASNI